MIRRLTIIESNIEAGDTEEPEEVDRWVSVSAAAQTKRRREQAEENAADSTAVVVRGGKARRVNTSVFAPRQQIAERAHEETE